ncbi:MAG TPA: hypothetical protein VFX70_12615 [Mycobacteriales bacterium]|nr:hypothetical protein [Mycobacteriales bacterium]
MSITTIRLDTQTRDRLSAVAHEFGASQETALNRLIDEHEMHEVHLGYARLQQDPEAWADYQSELAEWDVTTGDGLPDARDEYPEYNS